MTTTSLHVGSGLFISDSVLKEVGIENSEVEIEISDKQIHIRPAQPNKKEQKGIISPDSSFWTLVESIKTPHINGRDHDEHLYDKA